MKLNKNSFTARLVQFSYPNIRLSDNLCIYFWQVFFAYLFLPFICIHYLFESNFFQKKYENVLLFDNDSFIVKIGYTMGKLFIIGIFFFMFVIIGNKLQIDNIFITFIGGIIMFSIVVCICFIIIILINNASDFTNNFIKFISKRNTNIQIKLFDKEKKNIIIEYIKAKKQKICPRIEWE